MNISEIHPALREGLCIFSALRRLGFPADDIFVIFQETPEGHEVHVELSDKFMSRTIIGAKIAFKAGLIKEDALAHKDKLMEFCNLPDEHRESIVERLYPESVVAANHVKLVTSLWEHGLARAGKERSGT